MPRRRVGMNVGVTIPTGTATTAPDLSAGQLSNEIIYNAESAQSLADAFASNPTIQQMAQDLANALNGIALEVGALL